MRQEPTPAVRQDSQGHWRCIAPGLQRAWHVARRPLRDRWPQADSLVTPLSERPLWCVAAGLMAGSLLGTAVDLPLVPLSGALLIAGLLLLLAWPMPLVQRCCRLGLVGLALTSLQLAWQPYALPVHHIARLLPSLPQHVTVEGTLDRAVDARGDRQYVYLQLHRLEGDGGEQPVTGLVRLSVHTTSLPFLPGDVVRVTRLRLHPVRGSHNPGGFDFERFMRWRGIYVTGGVSNAERLSLRHRPEGFRFDRALEQWRQRLRTGVRSLLSAPYDGVFLAMVIGQRSDLTPEVQQSFRASGTTHLLVVSGLNVSCIAIGVLWVWRTLLRLVRSWLPRPWCPGWRPTPIAAVLSIPPVLLYCSLVGWEVPATRAALMVGSYLLALMLQRTREPLHTMVLAAALILVIEPAVSRDSAFQLSFVAVASIFVVSEQTLTVENPGNAIRRWGKHLRVYLLVNSAAYFGTLPIIGSTFHTVQTFAILANLPLVPLAGLLTQAGVAALGLLLIWPALAPWVFAPFTPLLTWIVTIAETVAAWPAAQLYIASPSVPMLLGYYGLLGSLLVWRRWRWCLRCAGLCLGLVLAGAGWQYLETRTQQLRVTFLDVGAGDAIVVQVPGNHTLLIDGGGTYDGRFDTGMQLVAPFLWQHYVRHFDLMALTHMHPDHARGLVSILRLFPTRHLLTNGSAVTSDYVRDLVAAGQRWGTQQHIATDGARHWQWERLQMSVLAPPETPAKQRPAWLPRNENDRSLVLRLQYGAVRLLLTGDIEQSTERWLLAQGADMRADILKVPHHGSKTSTSLAFVQQVQPQVGIISTGAGNPFGHPHQQVLDVLMQQGVAVWRTDRHGAITITSDGTGYRVNAVRPYRPVRPGSSQEVAYQAFHQEGS
jgi:competence protein ComEC